MKISTKGRYALVIMLDIASGYKKDQFISLKEIADKEDMSLKYLEKLMLTLKKQDYFISTSGSKGGYKLKYEPKHYKIADILRAAEGSLSVTNCISNGGCLNKHHSKTLSLWKDLNDLINNYLNSKTLEDYMEVDNNE